MQISVHSTPSMCVKSMAKMLFTLECGWLVFVQIHESNKAS